MSESLTQQIVGVPISGMPITQYKGSLLIPAVDTTQPLYLQNVSIAASGLMLGSGLQATSYTTNITASGSYQANATPLTTQINVVTSVYASGGVLLPQVNPGTWIRVFHEDNAAGLTLSVYPPYGQMIGNLGANYPSGMVYNQANDFNYLGSNQWYIK